MREQAEASAVKAQQTAAGAHPKIPVGGLRKGLSRLLRQTILRLPGADGVIPVLFAGHGCLRGRFLRLRTSTGEDANNDETC